MAVLALLNLFFDDKLQRLNALKALLQLVIGVVAALGFALLTPVAWGAAAMVGLASLVGGAVGARLAQRAIACFVGYRRLWGSPRHLTLLALSIRRLRA